MLPSYLRIPTQQDIDFVGGNLRAIDRHEVTLMLGYPAELAMASCLSLPDSITYTILSPSGRPMAICGAMGAEGEEGTVWLLGTDEIAQRGRYFLRHSKHMLAHVFSTLGCTSLHNLVHNANHVHRDWLKWMGAEFSPNNLNSLSDFERFDIRKPTT